MECEYQCEFHRGKIEGHHPIRDRPDIRIYLCEAHHSLVFGSFRRKKKYLGEIVINKTLEEMSREIWDLAVSRLNEYAYPESDIDKV